MSEAMASARSRVVLRDQTMPNNNRLSRTPPAAVNAAARLGIVDSKAGLVAKTSRHWRVARRQEDSRRENFGW